MTWRERGAWRRMGRVMAPRGMAPGIAPWGRIEHAFDARPGSWDKTGKRAHLDPKSGMFFWTYVRIVTVDVGLYRMRDNNGSITETSRIDNGRPNPAETIMTQFGCMFESNR